MARLGAQGRETALAVGFGATTMSTPWGSKKPDPSAMKDQVLHGSETQFSQTWVIIWPATQWPVELALAFLDRHIVDAGKAAVHQTICFKLPVFVAIGAEPVA